MITTWLSFSRYKGCFVITSNDGYVVLRKAQRRSLMVSLRWGKLSEARWRFRCVEESSAKLADGFVVLRKAQRRSLMVSLRWGKLSGARWWFRCVEEISAKLADGSVVLRKVQRDALMVPLYCGNFNRAKSYDLRSVILKSIWNFIGWDSSLRSEWQEIL